MKNFRSKIVSLNKLIKLKSSFARNKQKVVFTNGCFDILHAGHISYLEFAKQQGDILILGLNSDLSVKRNKGDSRPINCEQDRATVVAALEFIDYIVIFNEDEPLEVIAKIIPNVLVKGKDWAHYVCGREIVEENGGQVILADLLEGKSTTTIIKKKENEKST
jgi:D-beta-D-heptose 7-phosphate kinase/D-beta-D-heptose 1-phosphate adenosyltransferase